MKNDQNTVCILYKKLLTLYPRDFKERLGESMQQTFNDLYNERKHQTSHGLFSFVLWMFIETAIGIVKEYILLIMQGGTMKSILTNNRSAAAISFILCLPLAVTYVIFMFDMEPLIGPLNNLLTMDGQQITNLGRIVIFGGLLLLPVAFLLNLQPMLMRDGAEGKRRLYSLNLILGASILLLITLTWGGLILESIYCLQGIRCD